MTLPTQQQRQLAIMIGVAIQNTQDLREKIVQILNEARASRVDGIIALLSLSASHAKEDLERDEFMSLCLALYDSMCISKTEDIIDFDSPENN